MKTVCFVIQNINGNGGTERVSTEVANGLASMGYKIILCSLSEGKNPFFKLHDDVKTVSLFDRPGRTLYRTPFLISKLRNLFIEESVDSVIVIESMNVLFTLPAGLGLSLIHICWEHFNFKNVGHPGRKVARQLAALYCNFVVTLTERDKNEWLKGTKHKSNIVVIPNPSPFKARKVVRDKSNNTVIAVGHLVKVKGFDLLLRAWIQVVKEMPQWKLIIIGEGKERESLTQTIIDNQLEANVSLVGRTDNIGYFYEIADILCLSSRFEGLPMVLIEALSYALPVVSFDCDNGPAEILKNTGSILVPQGDIEQFALSLVEMMNNDKKRESISIKSIEKAKEYELSKIIKKWIDLIEG